MKQRKRSRKAIADDDTDEKEYVDKKQKRRREEPGNVNDEGAARRQNTQPKAKAKAKASHLRDQSKSKKFNELWDTLGEEIQSHWLSLTREEQTKYVEATIMRKNGKLIPQRSLMFDLLIERQEQQRGLEKMTGFGLEDIGHVQE